MAVTWSPRSLHRIAAPRCSAASTPSARRAVCPWSARADSSRARRRATPTTWSCGASSAMSRPAARRSAIGSRRPATSRRRHDWELGEAIAWAQQPLDTPDSLMRAWLASPGHRAIILDPRFRDVGIGITPGLTDGSDIPGATAVLDFGFRTASPTLPRWRSATACAGTAGRSRQAPARCASTSTRSRRSTPGPSAARPPAPLPGGIRCRRRRLPPGPRRDQLRLGLVPDPEQAPRASRRATSPSRGTSPTASASRRPDERSLRAMHAARSPDLDQAATTSSWPLRPGAARARRASSASAARSTSSPAGGSASGSPRCSPGHDDVDDLGFYKRAQIAANDLALAGVASSTTSTPDDLRRQPRPPRPALRRRARLRRGPGRTHRRRPPARRRRARDPRVRPPRLRAHRTAHGVPARQIDNALWTRGQAPEYKARPRHRCRTIYY